MPTVFSHAVVPLALHAGLGRKAIGLRLLAAGIAASVVPDLDVIALRFGIPYGDAFGHRGATHSIAFAVAMGEGTLPKLARGSPPAGARGMQRCDWPWRRAYVTYSGQSMPCCMIATPDRFHFGNMAKEGVVDVWNGDEYRAFRRQLDSDDPPSICRGCAVYNGTF